jgi:beta-1,2-mannobiose phosphorylase / 1,2-beta-oligomannan phosphorylase
MKKWLWVLGSILFILALGILGRTAGNSINKTTETAGGWSKYENNPVLGDGLGTCFDVSVLKKGDEYLMWFSWRPKKSIAFVKSRDGIHWGLPVIVLTPNPKSGWEEDVNRPVVIERGDGCQMWYTGQARGHSWIGYAVSQDGIHWKRMSQRPVLSAHALWERVAVMCPDVIWDRSQRIYRMWYSGGDQYEPNAIGYATSHDGIHWTKRADNPIFLPDSGDKWERQRVTACQVVQAGGWCYMFYIGFRDINHAQIGLARSTDGITGWQRLPDNPIIRTGIEADEWDHDACYKPYAVWDARHNRWLLWYNGRNGHFEQIGLAIHDGKSFGFPHERSATAPSAGQPVPTHRMKNSVACE